MTKEKRVTERQAARCMGPCEAGGGRAGDENHRITALAIFTRASTVRFQTRTSITLPYLCLSSYKQRKRREHCNVRPCSLHLLAGYGSAQGARESKRMKRTTSLKKTIWGVVRCPPPPTGTQHHTTPHQAVEDKCGVLVDRQD